MEKQRPPHPATLQRRASAPETPPHPATLQPAPKAPHKATLPAPQSPHPATVQRREGAYVAGRPPHPATVQRRVSWGAGDAGWAGAIQRARNNATMANLNGAQLAKQDELAWCYAAVISIITDYLNNGAGWKPCQIVSWALNENRFGGQADPHTLAAVCNCCKASKNRSAYCKGAEAVSPLDTVLAHLNITCTSTSGNLTFPTLKAEIDANRPVVLSLVRNDKKPGHMAMIVGYEQVATKPDRPELGSTAYAIVFDPAAQNTEYANTLDNASWTLRVPFTTMLGGYPASNGKWSIGKHHTNFAQAAALPAAPGWAVYV